MTTPPAPPMRNEAKISDSGHYCQALFLECAEQPQRLQDIRNRAELLRQRFHIWASNIGVFTSSSNATLDKRLEYSDEVKDLVIQLLSLMERNLKFGESKSPLTVEEKCRDYPLTNLVASRLFCPTTDYGREAQAGTEGGDRGEWLSQ